MDKPPEDVLSRDREFELRGNIRRSDVHLPGECCDIHTEAAPCGVDEGVERFAYLSRINHPADRPCEVVRR